MHLYVPNMYLVNTSGGTFSSVYKVQMIIKFNYTSTAVIRKIIAVHVESSGKKKKKISNRYYPI